MMSPLLKRSNTQFFLPPVISFIVLTSRSSGFSSLRLNIQIIYRELHELLAMLFVCSYIKLIHLILVDWHLNYHIYVALELENNNNTGNNKLKKHFQIASIIIDINDNRK